METQIMKNYFDFVTILEDIRYELSIMHPDDLQFVLGIITPLGEIEEDLWKQQLLQKNLDTMKK